jgi:hypothetical protein
MIHRVLIYGLFLAAVAVLPYASSVWLKKSRPNAAAGNSDVADAADGASVSKSLTAPSGATPTVALIAQQPPQNQPGVPPLVGLAEAIRFEVTVPWILHRWPRITTGLPDGELQGYRVPLVTGTREDDLAGSLTYYFNVQQVCQRITFQGTTGDPRNVAAFIAGKFGLIRRSGDDPGMQMYQTRWNGKPVSEMRIKAAPVVSASAPLARYEVQWTLNSWARR